MSPRSISRMARSVWSTPSESDFVWTAPLSPRPVKMSSIFPTPKTGWPAPATLAAAESLTALEIDVARVAIAPTGRAVVGVNDPEGPGTATATLATLPIGGGAWDTTRVPVGGDDADMALATAEAGESALPLDLALDLDDEMRTLDAEHAASAV